MGRVKGVTDYTDEIKIEAVQCYLQQFPEEICEEARRKKCLPRNDRVRNSDGLTKFASEHQALCRRTFVDSGESESTIAVTLSLFRD